MNDHIISKQHPIKAVGTEYVTLYTSTGFLPIVLFSPSQHAYILPNLKIITLNFRRSYLLQVLDLSFLGQLCFQNTRVSCGFGFYSFHSPQKIVQSLICFCFLLGPALSGEDSARLVSQFFFSRCRKSELLRH